MTNLDALQAIMDDLTYQIGLATYGILTCDEDDCNICKIDKAFREEAILAVQKIRSQRNQLAKSRPAAFPFQYLEHLNKMDNMTEAAYMTYPEFRVERKMKDVA